MVIHPSLDRSHLNTLFGFEMCFHYSRPLKTTSIQSNPIKKDYKTHNCHGTIATW
jgi:hypothetical protein